MDPRNLAIRTIGRRPKVFAKGRKPRRGHMNRTESAYAQLLEIRKNAGEILWFDFEGLRFRVGVGAWYCPDFLIMNADGTIECHETKGGFSREAAIVRIKCAAEKFPFKFVLVKFKRGQWTYQEMSIEEEA